VLALGSLVLAEGMARLIGELVDDVTSGAIAPLELGAAVELLAISIHGRVTWRAVTDSPTRNQRKALPPTPLLKGVKVGNMGSARSEKWGAGQRSR